MSLFIDHLRLKINISDLHHKKKVPIVLYLQYTMNMRGICIIGFFTLTLVLGCTKSSKLPQSAINTQQNRSQSGEAVYPHSDKFRTTKAHGLEYFSNPEVCKGCHGKELDGGSAEVACNSCHGIFPHTTEFKTTTTHGTEYFKNKLSCTQCHGVDYKGGDSNISCKKCHPYPHEAKWTLPTNHGATYLETSDTTKTCAKCHGEENSLKERHPEEFISCGTCHPKIPHDEDFKYPSDATGEHATMARTYKGQCTLCHSDYKRLMPEMGEDGCYSCHDQGKLPTVHWE